MVLIVVLIVVLVVVLVVVLIVVLLQHPGIRCDSLVRPAHLLPANHETIIHTYIHITIHTYILENHNKERTKTISI